MLNPKNKTFFIALEQFKKFELSGCCINLLIYATIAHIFYFITRVDIIIYYNYYCKPILSSR